MKHTICQTVNFGSKLVIFIPVIIVIASGLLLQVKKEFDWIQPPTQKVQNTQTNGPTISFDEVLHAVKQVPEVSLNSWDDIDR